jgi:hypothetical protein
LNVKKIRATKFQVLNYVDVKLKFDQNFCLPKGSVHTQLKISKKIARQLLHLPDDFLNHAKQVK